MKVDIRNIGQVAVVEVSGKVMGGPDTKAFEVAIREHLAGGGRNLIVDLERVEWITSQGLGMFLAAHRSVKNAGGRLALANITRVHSLLAMTRLITMIDTFDSREEALQALAPTNETAA